IGGHGRESVRPACFHASLLADVGEMGAAIVVKQIASTYGKAARAAMYWNPLPIAASRHFQAGVQIDVGAEEQVEMPVAIIVEKSAAGAPLRVGQREARFTGDVGKRAVAIVAEKHI